MLHGFRDIYQGAQRPPIVLKLRSFKALLITSDSVKNLSPKNRVGLSGRKLLDLIRPR
jgi:hypothetical protein